MHDSNLELVDNKRVPNSRVGKGVDQKKNFKFKSGRVGFRISSWLIIREPPDRVEWAKASIRKKFIFQCKLALGSNLELGDNKRAPGPRRLG